MSTNILPNLARADNGTSPPCPRCGASAIALEWAPMADGRRHIRETCATCRRFRRWAPQTAAAIAAADAAAKGGGQ